MLDLLLGWAQNLHELVVLPPDVGEEARVAIEGRGPPRPSGATPTPAARITMARKCHVDADFIYINGLGFYF